MFGIGFDNLFTTIVGILYIGAVVTTMAVVVLDNRNPVKTLSWVLILAFLPLAGLILYYFFGRDTRKEKLISKKGYRRLTKYPMAEYQQQQSSHKGVERYQLARFFRKVNGALPFGGNDIHIYEDGAEFIQDLLKVIAAAKHHIHMEFYVFEEDALGRLVRDALIDKAKEGVEVRFFFFFVGSWKLSHEFEEQMRSEGIETYSFLKVRFPLLSSRVNYRNHRKIVVIDGCVGFVGGMNIATRYLKGMSWGIWKDMHIKLTGKAVYGLQTAFLTDWYVVDRTLITSSRYFPEMNEYGHSLVQIVTSDPIGEWRDIMQGLLIAITGAKKYFYIQTPYLLPTEPILWALKTAALAGVDVRIMIPSRTDSRMAHLGSLSYLSELMEAGIKIYLYTKGFLHSKMMVSDDVVSTVGSTNMDFRSFEHNFEVNAFIYDRTSALKLKDIFLHDQKDAFLLSAKTWKKRPWYQKVSESVIRLFAPLL